MLQWSSTHPDQSLKKMGESVAKRSLKQLNMTIKIIITMVMYRRDYKGLGTECAGWSITSHTVIGVPSALTPHIGYAVHSC